MDGAAKKTGEPEASGHVVVVTGPTASGKSGLAAALAERLGGFVVNADSRQLYAELDIGVAKPTAAQLARAPHFLFGTRSIAEHASAGAYAREARETLVAGFATRRTRGAQPPVAVVVGGTGLYVSALVDGLPDMPVVPPELTAAYQRRLDDGELPRLLGELRAADPAYFERVDRANGARVVRALAVMAAAPGETFTALRAGRRDALPYRVTYVVLAPDTATLFARIDARADAMVAAGLEAEARALYPRRELRALQTLGYREWWPYFEGAASREGAIAAIKQATRRYARRQATWNRRLPGLRLTGPDLDAVLVHLRAP